MQAFEYKTRISSTGKISLPPDILKKLHLKKNSEVKILLLYEEDTPQKRLNRFCGKWQDDKNADEIVAELYESRNQNNRSEGILL